MTISDNYAVHPEHYKVFERNHRGWCIRLAVGLFADRNQENKPDRNDIGARYGISERQVVNQIIKTCGDAMGFYLANLKDKKYYYCGSQWSDVRSLLLSLGIGREDPMD